MPVSTSKQGRSGLGLDAQRAVLVHFAQTERFHIVNEFVEFDSDKGHNASARMQKYKGNLRSLLNIDQDGILSFNWRYFPPEPPLGRHRTVSTVSEPCSGLT
jgi:hypothetical protein